jgi:hypothetical protein
LASMYIVHRGEGYNTNTGKTANGNLIVVDLRWYVLSRSFTEKSKQPWPLVSTGTYVEERGNTKRTVNINLIGDMEQRTAMTFG